MGTLDNVKFDFSSNIIYELITLLSAISGHTR